MSSKKNATAAQAEAEASTTSTAEQQAAPPATGDAKQPDAARTTAAAPATPPQEAPGAPRIIPDPVYTPHEIIAATRVFGATQELVTAALYDAKITEAISKAEAARIIQQFRERPVNPVIL